MSPVFKKLYLAYSLLFTITLFSCSKTVGEKGAGEAVGTYTGVMTMFDGNANIRYGDYVVKVEHPSKEKIRVSCQSTPKIFDTFETKVTLANGTITSYGSSYDVYCQPVVKSFSFNNYNGGHILNYSGYK